MPINKPKSISACKFSFKSEGLSSFDKFFFWNAQFLHFWRAICARTGTRFMMRRKFNYAHFALIEELKARFEYLRMVFGRSENLSSFDEFFDIMLELCNFRAYRKSIYAPEMYLSAIFLLHCSHLTSFLGKVRTFLHFCCAQEVNLHAGSVICNLIIRCNLRAIFILPYLWL